MRQITKQFTDRFDASSGRANYHDVTFQLLTRNPLAPSDSLPISAAKLALAF
jgi:hypothetical protein